MGYFRDERLLCNDKCGDDGDPDHALSAQGVLGIKIIHKQDKLVSVNREHELYQAHTASAALAGDSSSASVSAAAARTEAAPSSSGRISVTFSYRWRCDALI